VVPERAHMRVCGRFLLSVIVGIIPCSYTCFRDIGMQCVCFNVSLFSGVLRAFQAPSGPVTTAPSGQLLRYTHEPSVCASKPAV